MRQRENAVTEKPFRGWEPAKFWCVNLAMARRVILHKPNYHPSVGPIGDVGLVFRKLGGLSRLDVVFAALGMIGVAFWRCVMTGKRKAVNASMKPAVCLLTYIPAEKLNEPA